MRKKKRPSSQKNAYKRLFAAMGQYKGRLILAVLFVLLSTVSSSFSSVLIKKFSAYENPVVIS